MTFINTISSFLPTDPVAIMQGLVLFGAFFLLFLLLFALRDILLRTRSFPFQFFCILLVGALPIVGFLVYLLIRPARTVKQREMDALLLSVFGETMEEMEGEEVMEEEDEREDEDDKDEREDEEEKEEIEIPSTTL